MAELEDSFTNTYLLDGCRSTQCQHFKLLGQSAALMDRAVVMR